MLTRDEIALRLGDAIDATPVPSPADVERFAAWDSVDIMALMASTPRVMTNVAGARTHDQASDIFREGVRGRTARSEIAKTAEIDRRILRHAQTFLAVHLDLLTKGRSNERRVKLFDQIVERAHRRMIASYQLLASLEAAPAPAVRISADRAAFQIDARVEAR